MMRNDGYIKGKGLMCPFCRAEQVEGGFISVENGKAFQEIRCTECDGTWQDVYHLVDVVLGSGGNGTQKSKQEGGEEDGTCIGDGIPRNYRSGIIF